MSIPDIVNTNPLSDAMKDATEETLSLDRTFLPPVLTPRDLWIRQQMELDASTADMQALLSSGAMNPFARAIMPDSIPTGYVTGKNVFGNNKDFNRFNIEFNKQFYDEHANKDEFPTYDSWIKGGTFSNINRALQDRTADIIASEDAVTKIMPSQYKGDAKSSLDIDLNLMIADDYHLMSKSDFENKYPNIMESFGGYESFGQSRDLKYLDKYIEALANEDGFTPRGVLNKPWNADYSTDIVAPSSEERVPFNPNETDNWFSDNVEGLLDRFYGLADNFLHIDDKER